MTKYFLSLLISLSLFAIPALAEKSTDELVAAALANAAETPAATPAVATTAPAPGLFQLSYAEAEEAVAWVLMQKGVGDKVVAGINGHKNNAPIFSYSKPVTVEIKGMQYDTGTGRWSASLLFRAEGEVVSALPASGHYDEMLEVPVLKRQVKNGEVIDASDIEVRDFPQERARNDTITDMSSLIGKSPLRTIAAFRPIHNNEIASPAIVKKNAMVQMRYTMPGMQITASGQAMGDGAKGDVIEVKNTASKKVIQAVVEDSSTVTIMPQGILTSQLTGEQYASN